MVCEKMEELIWADKLAKVNFPSNQFLTHLFHKNPEKFREMIIPWLKKHGFRIRMLKGEIFKTVIK